VERKRNIIEYNWRFREVRIVEIRVWTPLQSSSFQPIRQKSSQYPKYVYTSVQARRVYYLDVSFETIGFVVEVDSKMRFLLVEDAPVQSQNHIDQTTPLTNLANL
jgi:hypothetical protein